MIDEESITSSGALSVYHAAIDELARRYGSLEDSEHLSADEMIPPNGTFLVARRDGHLVGGVGLRAIADPGLRLGEVKRLWVRPDQRREGAGIALMGALEDRARSMGFVRLYLETGPRQPEALALYERGGWIPVEAFPDGAFSYPSAHRFTKLL